MNDTMKDAMVLISQFNKLHLFQIRIFLEIKTQILKFIGWYGRSHSCSSDDSSMV